jgi:hypothetical protein
MMTLLLRTSRSTQGSRLRLEAAYRADALLAQVHTQPFDDRREVLLHERPAGNGPLGRWLWEERVVARPLEDGLVELAAAVTWRDAGGFLRVTELRSLRCRPTWGIQAPWTDRESL